MYDLFSFNQCIQDNFFLQFVTQMFLKIPNVYLLHLNISLGLGLKRLILNASICPLFSFFFFAQGLVVLTSHCRSNVCLNSAHTRR